MANDESHTSEIFLPFRHLLVTFRPEIRSGCMKQFLSNRWLTNVLFLLLILAVSFLITKQYEPFENSRTYHLYHASSLVLVYIMTVLHNAHLLPIYTEKQQYWRYALLLSLWLGLATLLTNRLRVNIFRIEMDTLWVDDLVFCIVCLLVGIGIWFLHRQATVQNIELKNSLLMREKEIQYLQSQLNPHFFFNTLNNLYGVSLRYPGKTPGLILSISELMRYQLESSLKQRVHLVDELQFIRNYIHLERARVKQRCRVHFKKRGNEDGLYIAPLILIGFVENAFKYGPASMRESFIKVELIVKGQTLTFKISNSIPEHKELVSSMGVGLNNVKQRLALMYPGKHQLHAYEENKVYYTTLSLVLNGHE